MRLGIGRHDLLKISAIFPRTRFFWLILMHLFYIDESGTPETSGNSKQFVLAAIGLPIDFWREADQALQRIKFRYGIKEEEEVHVAWMCRTYHEQTCIENFEKLSAEERRLAVKAERAKFINTRKKEAKAEKDETKKRKILKTISDAKKLFNKTEAYTHLTETERRQFVRDLAEIVGRWKDVRIFAEIIDKSNYTPPAHSLTPTTQAFEQVVLRIEKFLEKKSSWRHNTRGILIYDNNPSVASQLTLNMKNYFKKGTFLSSVKHLVEVPLFIDSSFSGMVQIADLCAYALRRYVEFNEKELVDLISPRFDKKPRTHHILGVRHYTSNTECQCIFPHKHPRKEIST